MGVNMKKFIVYLLVIVLTVSLGFAVFYLVRDNEVISISSASIYKDVGDNFTLDVEQYNKKKQTKIEVVSSDDDIVSGSYNTKDGQYRATAHKGGVARINVKTTNSKFRNLWCDVIVGDGTVESPFYISTAEQLAAIGMGGPIEGQDGVFYGAEGYERYHSNLCYKLVSNIDVSSVNQGFWVPLQNFNGRFDANGCTITNIYIDAAGYREAMGDKADVRFKNDGTSYAGLFATTGKDATVYNLKLEDFTAIGTYKEFGSVSAVNYGTIERIEVKDAYLSVKTAVIGGIVGTNVTTVTQENDASDENVTTAKYVRHIARVDRTSVNNLVMGQSRSVDPSGNVSTSVLGATGYVGGVVGYNIGGTIAYSYARGEIYFGDDTTNFVTYGGVVGYNQALKDLSVNSEDESKFQGASIRDCYSDIKTILSVEASEKSYFGGAIGINEDFQDGNYENSSEHLIVNNYLLGIYYNKDGINYAQEGMTKEFVGIAKFTLDGDVIDFSDKETIVYGLNTYDMKIKDNFISHSTIEIQFNEDGSSKGLVERDVLWLFDTVWAIDADTNDGMPYLNYRLVYVPDDFQTVGVPVVSDDHNDYYFKIKIDYPISILSGTDSKVRIKVEEFYQLVYSPTGIEIDWKSSNENIVKVDSKGKLEGVAPGVATVTATTTSGSQDEVTVIVENIPYKIEAPSKIYLYEGETFNVVTDIKITPTPRENDKVDYTIKDTSIVSWQTTGTVIKADKVGTTTLTIKVADTQAVVDVIVVAKPTVTVNTSTKNIEGYLSDMKAAGTDKGVITVTSKSDASIDFAYKAEFLDNKGAIANISVDNSAADGSAKINYEIKGVGQATLKISITTDKYTDSYVYVYFNIKDETYVTLTMSPASVSGYYNYMDKEGTITVKNSANVSLQYKVQSSDTNIVFASVNGNVITYNISAVGTAYIKVDVKEGQHTTGTGYVYFTIQQGSAVVETLTLSKTSITIYEGDSYKLSASGSYSSLTWESIDIGVAIVDNTGMVTGAVAGTTTIVAKTGTGVTATCNVHVKTRPIGGGGGGVVVVPPTYNIYVNPTVLTLNVGETYQLSSGGTYSKVKWSATGNVTVDSNGKVTAGSTAGSGVVTATALDSSGSEVAYATCAITVTSPITMSITANKTIAYVGDYITFTATASDGNNSVIEWGTVAGPWDKNDYTVYPNNVLKVKATGVGTIYVIATYGPSGNATVSARASVTVKDKNAYDPYIYNLQQLNNVRNNPDKAYYLAANITVGSNWDPIKNFTGSFTALANGSSYFYITGLTTKSGLQYAGLFANTVNATISNLKVANSTITATASSGYAGGIAGCATGTKFNNCTVNACTISATSFVGGITGYATSSTVISNSTSSSNTISISTNSSSYAGGIIGNANYSVANSCAVRSTKITVPTSGYVGGVLGYALNSRAGNTVVSGCTISISTGSSSSNAGGIVGYTNGSGGSYIEAVYGCTVRGNTTITGYYAGGIAGRLSSSRSYTIKFNEYKSGFRSEDTSTLSYSACIGSTAVKTDVTVKGVRVGGLCGAISAGAVENSYARANLQGASSSAIKGGFAASISASSAFTNTGGSGTVGLVRYCYSACTFGGSGSNYSITSSLVHNYATSGNGSGRAGYCMNYVFDDGKDGNATYYHGSNILASDKVKAKKSSSEMQSSSTYTGKGFSSTYWSISGYPTLRTERS